MSGKDKARNKVDDLQGKAKEAVGASAFAIYGLYATFQHGGT